MTESGKHCGKRRNCSFWAISSFVTVFSKSRLLQRRQKASIWGKGSIVWAISPFATIVSTTSVSATQIEQKTHFDASETDDFQKRCRKTEFLPFATIFTSLNRWLQSHNLGISAFLPRCLQNRLLQIRYMWERANDAIDQIGRRSLTYITTYCKDL